MIFRNILIFSLMMSSLAYALDRGSDSTVDQWLAFMKYEKIHGVYKSPVTNPAFFLSPKGAGDADEELRATIRIFSESHAGSDKHPQCLYPARYEILRKKFPLAPPVACPNFDSWRNAYGLTNIKVLYGSQYISNPTSAFGHSFFLLDSETTLEYLRVTYNYGADIPADVGARLIIDGLGGGFQGNYSVVPLYHRLHSYNDIENRDIWEYTLVLTPAERDLLVKILWEVQGKFSEPYYFLNGNCANAILEMINIVRPDLKLRTSSPLFSSPQEIFRVLDKNGLIASFSYRPSLEKQLDQKINSLSADQKKEFREVLRHDRDFPRDALLAETALTYVQLLRQKNQGETPESLKSFERKALLARAGMPELAPFPFAREHWPAPPHEAQGPNMMAVGRGSESAGAKTTFIFRPAFHDFMQTNAGFLTDSSIDVLDFKGSIRDGRAPRLDSLMLGRIVNFREVKSYDPFATSWMAGGQILRNPFIADGLRYQLAVSPEMGFATRALHPSLLLFALAGLDLRQGSVEPFGQVGVGPRIGVIGSFGRWKAFLSYHVSWQSADAETWQKRQTEFQLRYNLNREWDVLGEYNLEETARREKVYQETAASVRYSF